MPLFYHNQDQKCDGLFDCMDRSDEDNCMQVRSSLEDNGVQDSLDGYCFINAFQLPGRKRQTHGNNLIVSKHLPEHERFQRCPLNPNERDKERGFSIGNDCFPARNLCSLQLPNVIKMRSQVKIVEWRYHPQHITICQNLTFWNEQRQSRNHIYCSTVTTTVLTLILVNNMILHM